MNGRGHGDEAQAADGEQIVKLPINSELQARFDTERPLWSDKTPAAKM